MIGFRINDADRDQCMYSIKLIVSKETTEGSGSG